jgi:hypothetical protein
MLDNISLARLQDVVGALSAASNRAGTREMGNERSMFLF